MKPYVHGQTATAQLVKANAKVNFLEHELARLERFRRMLPKNSDQWPAFNTAAFREEYERERAWAARRWPEAAAVKEARLALLVAETYRPAERLAA